MTDKVFIVLENEVDEGTSFHGCYKTKQSADNKRLRLIKSYTKEWVDRYTSINMDFSETMIKFEAENRFNVEEIKVQD